ncbi:MAG: radical SAM family heme chaperone HemW [Nitrospira sp.]|nr:radical SAM family heme chaperone HemW [Nitrospira sp.]
MSVGLYIHVPFCRTRCHFCAFYLQIHRHDKALAYLEALRREIHLHTSLNSFGGQCPSTLYFGGGTPTTLSPDQLDAIVARVRTCFGLQEGAEITLEAHPDTVTEEGLRHLVQTGCNRISFGAQSMDEEELIKIGRRTSAKATSRAVEWARAAGFSNINLDLIYGLPGQTMESWIATLGDALILEPTHLSCYALTVEEDTRLAVDLRRGDRTEPDALLQNAMEDEAALRLTKAGFQRYEISNYCRPGYACRHNLLYWQDGDYLGLGPSAQSYLDGVRFGNVEDLAAYQKALEKGQLPTGEEEKLSLRQRQREALVFGLRLTEGVDLQALGKQSQDSGGKEALYCLTQQGFLEERSGRIKLTALGRRYADSVAVSLL